MTGSISGPLCPPSLAASPSSQSGLRGGEEGKHKFEYIYLRFTPGHEFIIKKIRENFQTDPAQSGTVGGD